MRKLPLFLVASVGLGFLAAGALAQDTHPILDKIADKVVQKYKTSSCEELAAERAHKWSTRGNGGKIRQASA